jgi:hypothetical protein
LLKRFDLLAVSPVHGVVVSATEVQGNREKYREFHRFWQLLAILAPVQQADSVVCKEIPYAMEQGISRRVSGNFGATNDEKQGISGGDEQMFRSNGIAIWQYESGGSIDFIGTGRLPAIADTILACAFRESSQFLRLPLRTASRYASLDFARQGWWSKRELHIVR